MPREALGAHFEIKLDRVPRSYRDVRETAIEAARFLQQRTRGSGFRCGRAARWWQVQILSPSDCKAIIRLCLIEQLPPNSKIRFFRGEALEAGRFS